MDQWYAMISWFIAGKITELKSRLKKNKNYIDPNQNPYKYIYTYIYIYISPYLYCQVSDKSRYLMKSGKRKTHAVWNTQREAKDCRFFIYSRF